MKQSVQIVIAVVILLATIGGVTFVGNWVTTPSPDPPTPNGQHGQHGVTVHFPVSVIEESREFELRSVGHQDFRFQNTNDKAVELGFSKTGCICAKVEAIVLSDDDEKRLGGMNTSAAQQFLDANTGWQLLEGDGTGNNIKTISVSPQAVGFVRLSWEAKQLGPVRQRAGIWAREVGQPKTRGPEKSLEVPIIVVNPIQISTTKIDVPDLRAGQTQFGDFYCFSTTRPGFKVMSVTETSADPCFTCAVTQLKGDELEQAVKVIGQPAGRLVCVYRVRVNVHERAPDGNAVLDLGPYQREIVLTTDEKDHPELTISVNGTVRGDVTVGTEESQDRVLLKTFPSNKGKEVTIPIEAVGMTPKKWTCVPDFIKAEIPPDSVAGDRFKLKVTVPPKVLNGPVPKDAAVFIEFDNKRRLRIPIVGRATVPVETQ